ncbi:O-antigen ligase family protein [Halococcus qingdaonensis]|uniref:O-antigen ligase family protein n=1 Tax=Halococcus qingdaonensis TaxID=224402 RepID=UPI0021161D42|nr:O-antigen ligase family protein [Halococcus qingdaonensis]
MRHSLAAASALILTSSITVIPEIPQTTSYIIFSLVFIIVFVYALWTRSNLAITARPGILIGTATVWFALFVGLVRSPTVGGILRVGAFIVFSGATMFVLPSIIPRRTAYRSLVVIAAGFGAFGIITAIIGPVGPLGIYRRVSIIDISYGVPLSLFKNPNILANVALLGTLAAGGIVFNHQSENTASNRGAAAILGIICAIVVVISGSRAALLALLAGGGVLVVAHRTNPQITAIATLGGLVAIVAVIVVAATINVDFSGRFELWAAALRATIERPAFGWGPGASADVLKSFLSPESQYSGFSTHNSYIRMFFMGGIVGGVGYLFLSMSALRVALRASDPTTLALVVAALVFFVFETGTIFGLAPISFASALAIGYAQQDENAIILRFRSSEAWRWGIIRIFT